MGDTVLFPSGVSVKTYYRVLDVINQWTGLVNSYKAALLIRIAPFTFPLP